MSLPSCAIPMCNKLAAYSCEICSKGVCRDHGHREFRPDGQASIRCDECRGSALIAAATDRRRRVSVRRRRVVRTLIVYLVVVPVVVIIRAARRGPVPDPRDALIAAGVGIVLVLAVLVVALGFVDER
jgi:hypothetical protein